MPRHATTLISMLAIGLCAVSGLAQDRHERHKHALAGDVDAFHKTLAPLWHAQAGERRTANVCVRAGRLESLARAIQGRDTRTLVDAVAALKLRCISSPGDIDAAFSGVHEAFHGLTEHAH